MGTGDKGKGGTMREREAIDDAGSGHGLRTCKVEMV